MTGKDRQPELAAERAVNGDRLLPGEDPDTDVLEDALLWLNVYSELLAFKQSLVKATEDSMERMTPPAREEVGKTDALVLRAEAERFTSRLAYWRRRRDELLKDDAPGSGEETGGAQAAS